VEKNLAGSFAFIRNYRVLASIVKNMHTPTAIATLRLPMPLGIVLLHAVSADCYRAAYYCYGYYYRCSTALSQAIRRLINRT
jgi:hypothetical protein